MKTISIDPEDLEDLIIKVEKSFDIAFEENELIHINTFGELVDSIKDKISLEKDDKCTSQQAFYKLRESISNTTGIEQTKIIPSANLDDIFSRKERRSTLKIIDRQLGFETKILVPHRLLVNTLLAFFFCSIIILFFNQGIGMIALLISIIGFYISFKTGKEFEMTTIREFSQRITQVHYVNVRRNKKNINQNEIEPLLTDLFVRDLGLKKTELTRNTRLFD